MRELARVEDIPAHGGLRTDIDGKPAALFRVGERVYAIGALCPHRGGPLDQGHLDGTVVYCPWHGWDFDVCTGLSPTFGEQLPCYPVEVRDGIVYVKE